MESAIIGLSVIIIAWILQLIYSWNGKREIKKRFLVMYSLGVCLLIIDSYINDATLTGIFNLASLVVALLVLIRISASPSVKKISPKKRKR
jgi:hypothetical protein